MNLGGFNVGGADLTLDQAVTNATQFAKNPAGGLTIELRTRFGSYVYDPANPDASPAAGPDGGLNGFGKLLLAGLDPVIVIHSPAGEISRRLNT